MLFSFPDLSLLIKLYQTMNDKSSIRRKLKKVVVKGLTNGTKHDIIRISKLSVVTFNTDFRRMIMNFIDKETLKQIRETFPNGTRVELIKINDPYNKKLRPGAQGTVVAVDDVGTIHVAWDCNSFLGVVYGEDVCRKIT